MISRHDKDNIGGFHTLWIGFAKNFPDVDPDAVLVPWSLVQQHLSSFEQVYFTPGTGSFEQPAQRTVHGQYHDHVITFSIPCNRADVVEKLRKYKGAALICLVETHNQDKILVGSQSQPLQLTSDLKFGADPGDRNHRPVTISGQSINEAPFTL